MLRVVIKNNFENSLLGFYVRFTTVSLGSQYGVEEGYVWFKFKDGPDMTCDEFSVAVVHSGCRDIKEGL